MKATEANRDGFFKAESALNDRIMDFLLGPQFSINPEHFVWLVHRNNPWTPFLFQPKELESFVFDRLCNN